MMLFHSVLLAMALTVELGEEKEWYRTVVRQELEIIDKKLPGAESDPRRDIHVFVEVSPVQPRVAGGIFFVIDVVNEGSEPVELTDITADGRIGLSVWNADGVPVDLPHREGKGNPGGWARRHGLPEHVKAEIEQRRPFAVMKPDLLPDDPKVKSIDSIKDGKIRLEPGEHFQVQVLVTKVLAEPEKWRTEMEKRSVPIEQAPPDLKPPGPPKIQPIPSGMYRLGVYVGLAVPGQMAWGASGYGLLVRLGPSAAGSPSTSGGKPESTLRRSQLMEGWVEDPQNDALSRITAFVDLDTIQPDVSNGINFLVDILNPGSEPVELLPSVIDMRLDNPIIIYLYDALGIRVDIPDPNWVYLESLRVQEAGKPEHAGGRLRRDAPFHLTESEWDQGPARTKSLRDVKAGKVTLGPGEHFQLRARIEEVLADPELWWPLEPQKELPAHLPKVIHISPGMYFLKIGVWLRTDVERFRLVSSNGLLVELGPK